MQLPEPTLELFCNVIVELGPIRELGEGRAGKRRIIPILGGKVSGPYLSGKVVNVGADWQTIFASGLAQLDARYPIETDDGALIEVINFGHRHGPEDVIKRLAAGEPCAPEDYYMRSMARFETGDPRYAWMNNMIFLGTGAREKASVILDFYLVR
tara:strand:+ start:10100 stop:10564 length:465 start_codon:yes stop_codon:yes gene_type:complete